MNTKNDRLPTCTLDPEEGQDEKEDQTKDRKGKRKVEDPAASGPATKKRKTNTTGKRNNNKTK